MFGLGDFGDKLPSWFLKIFKNASSIYKIYLKHFSAQAQKISKSSKNIQNFQKGTREIYPN